MRLAMMAIPREAISVLQIVARFYPDAAMGL
jgi:hypothetical protein